MRFALKTHDLSIGYTALRKSDVVIAKDLSLTLNRGELVCLLGPNGVGKSTLMRTLAGMQKRLAGRIIVGGDDLVSLDPRQRAVRLSVVLTDRPHLGLLNGYALVALGRHPHTDWRGRLSHYDEAMIRWAVDAVDAADFAGYPVMELSDGQRQKLMIARALAQEAEIILLDEPTAYLDLPHRAEIMQLLRHLTAETGRSILLSTHDLELALRSADTFWLMSDGEVCVGTPEDMILNDVVERTFASENVTFDQSTGSFTVNQPTIGIVHVSGQGIPLIWTRRALIRAGFTLATNGTVPAIQVEVIGDETTPTWSLHQYGKRTIHHSIIALLVALKRTQSED